MRQKFMSVALACILCLGMAVPAYAAEQPAEIEAAGAYLRERGVYQGDGSGSLMLDKGLTRAEMAAILTRLHGGRGQSRPLHLPATSPMFPPGQSPMWATAPQTCWWLATMRPATGRMIRSLRPWPVR